MHQIGLNYGKCLLKDYNINVVTISVVSHGQNAMVADLFSDIVRLCTAGTVEWGGRSFSVHFQN